MTLASMAVGTVGHPPPVVLKQIEAAGTHPPRYAAVQRWHLALDGGWALLLFGARVGREVDTSGTALAPKARRL